MKRHYIALLSLLIASIGCNMADGGKGNATSANAAANTAANSTKKTADANTEVAAAFQNLKIQPFVTAKIDDEGPNTKYDRVIEAAGPEKVRLVYVYVPGFEPDPSTASEMVQVGEEVYEKKVVDGYWVKVDYKMTVFDEMVVGPASIMDFAPAADETVDGKDVSVYTLEVVTPEAPKGINGKVWILKDKKVPLKARIDRPNGASTTYTYDIDTPVKPIEAPKNVRGR